MTKPAAKHREYVSERIRYEVMVIVILFMFVAAILNISISPRVSDMHEPDAEYIGHVVSKTVLKHWEDSTALSHPY